MKEFIVKKIIKDDPKCEKGRVKHGIFAGIIGILTNVILVLGKLFIGFISGSVSIIADAINNLSDCASNIVTVIGFKLSNKEADDDHPFGHERIEYIIGLIISVIILVIGFDLIVSSIKKIINPEVVDFNIFAIIVLVASILIKLYQSSWYKFLGRRIDSISLIASSKDSINDCLSTLAVLISVIIFMIFKINIDAYMGCLVSLFIIYSGIKLILETSDPLIGKLPNRDFVDKMLMILLDNEYILGFHDLVIHSYGPNKYYATIHLEFDYKVNVLEIHEQIDYLEKKVNEDLGINLVVHMDPIVNDDDETNNLRAVTKNLLLDFDPRLSLHDFRLVKGKLRTNVIFDCVLPKELKKEDVLNYLKEEYKKINEKYVLIIVFDSLFNYKEN